MKILVLGDIEGRTCWKNIVELENPDLTIFLGDLVSTHFPHLVTEKQQVDNMENILRFKEESPDTVILLRGNHCMEACDFDWAYCSPSTGHLVKRYMKQNLNRYLDNSQWIYQYKNIVFSHAGVSSVWMKNNNIEKLEDINTLEPSEIFGFTPNRYSDFSGSSETQPPTWIRPWTLLNCGYKGVIHVVGHTQFKFGIDNLKKQSTNVGYKQEDLDHMVDVWCCDTLPEQYLIIENEKFIVKNYDN